MPDVYIRTVMLMSTWVSIQVVGHASDQQQAIDRRESGERAFEWFRRVEECCTRFDPQSEIMQLSTHIGVPVPVSELLYEAVQFAVAVAEGAAAPCTEEQPATRKLPIRTVPVSRSIHCRTLGAVMKSRMREISSP